VCPTIYASPGRVGRTCTDLLRATPRTGAGSLMHRQSPRACWRRRPISAGRLVLENVRATSPMPPRNSPNGRIAELATKAADCDILLDSTNGLCQRFNHPNSTPVRYSRRLPRERVRPVPPRRPHNNTRQPHHRYPRPSHRVPGRLGALRGGVKRFPGVPTIDRSAMTKSRPTTSFCRARIASRIAAASCTRLA